MLTHDEMIFCICEMTGVSPLDHGKYFLVGMDIVNGKQVSSASVDYWGFDDVDLPSDQDIHSFWEKNKSSFNGIHNYMVKNIIPTKVTRSQIKSALMRRGLWSDIVGYAMLKKGDYVIAIEDSIYWYRSSDVVINLMRGIGLNDNNIDEIFKDASNLAI